jgi:hypothetical protein
MFVFYNQLMNSMKQFGVCLVSLSKLKHNESVCPAQYSNIPITSRQYQSMASTLYQKLQSPDVVPFEHTAIRNIINRFPEQNDGYQVFAQKFDSGYAMRHMPTGHTV